MSAGRECLPRVVCLPGGGVCLGRGVCLRRSARGFTPHSVDRMTDTCENITFPQLLLRTVITVTCIRIETKNLVSIDSFISSKLSYTSMLAVKRSAGVTQSES